MTNKEKLLTINEFSESVRESHPDLSPGKLRTLKLDYFRKNVHLRPAFVNVGGRVFVKPDVFLELYDTQGGVQ